MLAFLSGVVALSAIANGVVLFAGYVQLRDRMLLFLLLPRMVFFVLWVVSISPLAGMIDQSVLHQVAILLLLWTDMMYHSLVVAVSVR